MSTNLYFLIYIFFHLVCLSLLINFNYASISSICISSKEPLVLGIVGGVALATPNFKDGLHCSNPFVI